MQKVYSLLGDISLETYERGKSLFRFIYSFEKFIIQKEKVNFFFLLKFKLKREIKDKTMIKTNQGRVISCFYFMKSNCRQK